MCHSLYIYTGASPVFRNFEAHSGDYVTKNYGKMGRFAAAAVHLHGARSLGNCSMHYSTSYIPIVVPLGYAGVRVESGKETENHHKSDRLLERLIARDLCQVDIINLLFIQMLLCVFKVNPVVHEYVKQIRIDVPIQFHLSQDHQ